NFRIFFHTAAVFSHLGVMRATDMLSGMTDGLSDLERERGKAFFVAARHLKSAARELDAWNETTDQTRSVQLGAIPVLILSASEPQVEWVKDFQALHKEMINLSSHAVHRIVPGVEHLNFVTHRDNAELVSNAIFELVERHRRSSKG